MIFPHIFTILTRVYQNIQLQEIVHSALFYFINVLNIQFAKVFKKHIAVHIYMQVIFPSFSSNLAPHYAYVQKVHLVIAGTLCQVFRSVKKSSFSHNL